jgi:hypothetical protein
MSFARHIDARGQVWLVDSNGIQHLLRSYARSKAVLGRSSLNYEPQDMGWMGVLSSFKLTLVTVRTNYVGLANQISDDAVPLWRGIQAQLKANGLAAFNTLVGYRNETVNNNEAFREMQVDASQQTNAAIARVTANARFAEDTARTIRDLSTTVLTVGATFLSGGNGAGVYWRDLSNERIIHF